jgi:outer membrane receptor protein involved in Fe transport
VLSHEQRVPTGTFGNVFNDPRTDRLDRSVWVDLSHAASLGPRLTLTSRLYGDRFVYAGNSAYHPDSVFVDRGDGRIAGAEVLGVWESSSRNRLTVGGEYRHVGKAYYVETFPDGTSTADDAPNAIRSVFLQDEYQLSPRVKAVGGWRLEDNRLHGMNTAPRVALILTPSNATTIKALYGEAFRAPSAAEADLQTAFYGSNPDLRAERIHTSELALTHRMASRLLLGGSVYHYRIRDLIDQVEFNDEGQLQYRNTASAEGAGAEMEFDLRASHALQLRGTYAFQFFATDGDGERLSNAPSQVAMLAGTLGMHGLRSTLALRHESGRRTFTGTSTKAFVRADAYVGTDRALLVGAQAGLRITNLLNTTYATPVGIEHVGPSMPQPSRRLSLELTWRF